MTREASQAACSSCGRKLPADAQFCPGCGAPTPNDPLVGQIAGERYRIIELIGHGGSGTIYRGEHVTLRRKVAVKVLHHELSQDDLALERFRREATTVGEIDNDHIVDIHDFGRLPDGRLYLAMELCEGETLAELIARQGRLGIEQATDILTQLGEALMEAHAMGYVHRDLRPRNVFLARRRGREGFVKLLDFGLAKLVAKGGAASTSLGMTFGDPKYMSPEQARGDPVDQRADIYSLGCIAYEMLCGEPPFSGGRVFDILTKHVESTPAAPADKRAEIPAWLSAAVMRMLAKTADERFATVYRMIGALDEGQKTGSVMPDAIARRRESEPPPSVSRAMAKLGARAAAEAKLEAEEDASAVPAPIDDANASEAHEEVPVGKRQKRRSSGLSGAWYADGEALESDDSGILGERDRSRLSQARRGLRSQTGSTSQIYFDPDRRRRLMMAAGGVVLVVGVILAMVLWPDSDPAAAKSAPAPDAQAVAAVPVDAGTTVATATVDAAPVASNTDDRNRERNRNRDRNRNRNRDRNRDRDRRDNRDRDSTDTSGGGGDNHAGGGDGQQSSGGGGNAADREKSQQLAAEGLQAFRDGDILTAAGKLNRALELYPRNAAAIAGLGEIALTQGAAQDAAHHLRRATRIRPTARNLTLLGDAYLALGNRERAKDAYKRALKRDPDNVRARNGYNEAAGFTP